MHSSTKSFSFDQITGITLLIVVISIYKCSLSVATSTNIIPKQDHYLLSCGLTPASTISFNNQSWASDDNPAFASRQTLAAATSVAYTAAYQVPCNIARIFNSTFTYTFPVSVGPKFARLYFCPATYIATRPSKFFLSVEADGGAGPFTLLHNFNGYQSQKGVNPVVQEFIVEVNVSRLTLTFSPTSTGSLAFINGIEIASIPQGLYDGGFYENSPRNSRYVNFPSTEFEIKGAVAMQTVGRINVGGPDVARERDSGGMMRVWTADPPYLVGNFTGNTAVTTATPYTNVSDSAAPDTVYQSVRFMSWDNQLQNLKNLTWKIMVDHGFDYLVRLHFCQIFPEISKVNQMVFKIFINGMAADTQVDLIAVGGKWGVPLFNDYVVSVYGDDTDQKDDADNKGNNLVHLWIALHPDITSRPEYYNAMLNGLEVFKLSGWNRSLAAPNMANKVPTSVLPHVRAKSESHPKKWSNKLKRTIIAAISMIGSIMVFSIVIFSFTKAKSWRTLSTFTKRKTKDIENIEALLQQYGENAPKRYTYADIKRMTSNFESKLGQGGYGSVYKGKLQSGLPVAIKLLKRSPAGDKKEFVNEFSSITGTNHVNIVTLIGLCFEGHKRALVYEYMPKGSLDKYICSGANNECDLDVGILLKIAVGIARGLEYLHRGCKTRVLHLDIKPHNILLDENFVPKISDFGLARPCRQRESRVTMSGARGTPGFIAPEVFCREFGGASNKSDVYSYGMLLLDMVGCRKNNTAMDTTRQRNSSNELYFPQWIYKQLEFNDDQDNEVLEMSNDTNKEKQEQQKKMVIVSLWCIQTNPSSRPCMSQVVAMLEGSLESLPIPTVPYLYSPPRSSFEKCSSTSPEVAQV